MKKTLAGVVSRLSRLHDIFVMVSGRVKESEVPLCAFVALLLTHCYSVLAILDRRVYADEDLRRNYRLEDFLWSGSGDGENETEPSPTDEPAWERTTTVFHTTTVISTATIFYKTLSTVTTPESNTTDCIGDPDCVIEPTPTIQLSTSTTISPWPPPTTEYPYGDLVPDQRYWLITVLKMNTSVDFISNELEEHLAKLYTIAFHRHQEHHLGLNASWNKSSLRAPKIFRQKRDRRDKVTVHIHNITNDQALKILYSVKVSGHPVLATVAADDMKLVSDAEVVAELGYPILTKAIPYLKPTQQLAEQGIFHQKEHLFVLVSSICAVILIILFVLLFLLTVKKRKRRMQNEKTDGQQFLTNEHSRSGIDNEAFLNDSGTSKSQRKQHSSERGNGNADSASEDLDGGHESEYHLRPHSRRPVSPNSYLSMPSVRDFPTTPLPEPLKNILKSPPSIDDKPTQVFSRHGSLEADDPGVVGPVVWDTHCHRLRKQAGLPHDDDSSFDSDIDVGRMRRRFNELLDDALSLYESHRSPHHHRKHETKKSFDHRSQSAAHFREEEIVTVTRTHSRPKTSTNEQQRQNSTQKCFPQPRGAWNDSNPATPVRHNSRPLSAGPFHRPTIYPEIILSDAQLSPNDPAVPIISAIKQELDKIPTYKSTTRTKRVTLRESFGDDDHEA